MAQNVAKIGTTKYATLQEAIEKAADGETVELIANVDDFGAISFADKTITLHMAGFTAKGTSITVSGTNGCLEICKYWGKTPEIDENYNIVNENNKYGTLVVKKSIIAQDGAKIDMYGAKVVSTTNCTFRAVGDCTGKTDIQSSVKIRQGYVQGREGAVCALGRGAKLTIYGGLLEALDNAVVAGRGNKEDGQTSIEIQKATLIGRIKSPGYAACGVFHPQQGELKISSGTKIIAINGAGILMRGGTLNLTSCNINATGDKDFTGKVDDCEVKVGTSGIVYDYDCGYYDVANVKVNVSSSSAMVNGSRSAIDVINTKAADVSNVFNITEGNFSSDVSAYIKDANVESYKHGGIYSVGNFVAQIDDVKYTSVANTIANAGGKTVVLLKDCKGYTGNMQNIRSKATLDLNGKTFTLFGFSINSELTIKDSSAKDGIGTGTIITNGYDSKGNSSCGVIVNPGGKFNLEGGTIKNDFAGDGWDMHKNIVFQVLGGRNDKAGGILNISGGVVDTKGTPVSIIKKGATVNVSGGELKSNGLACIAGNGSAGMGGTTINVSGGTLTANAADEASAACGIYHPNEGTLNITGGTINVTDGVGVLMRGGEMTMTGGVINATGDATRTGTVGDNNNTIGVSGVIFDRDANYPAVANTSISIDGKAKVNGAKEAVELINTKGVADAKSAFSLKGGTYNKDVSALLDKNSAVAEKQGEVYVVNTYCAQVGENKYTTLQAAVDAVKEGGSGNIEVIADATFTDLTIRDKTIYLDLLKHTIKGNYIDVINKGATLYIKDTSPDKALSVDKDNDYAVSYTNSGTVEMTHIIGAYYGAGINVESGTIVSTNDMALSAIGDDTGEKDIKSYIKITGGYIKAKSYCASPEGRGASVTIEGNAVLESLDNAVVAGNGTNTATKKLGGTSISIGGPCWLIGRSQTKGDAACGIYHPQQGTLTLKNSSGIPNIVAVNGAGIVMRGGTLDYSAGNITATGDANFTGKIGDSSVEVGTCGIVYDRDCGYYDVANAKINISDNSEEKKVVGAKSAIQVINDKNQNIYGVFDIRGGNFSSDVSEYCTAGFTATPNADGTYGISKVGDLSVMVAYDRAYENVVEGGTVDIDMDKVNKIMVAKTEVANVTTTLTKTFSNTGWNAFFVPFDFTLTAEMLNNFEFATLFNASLENGNGSTIIAYHEAKAGETIKAYLPCLIKAKATGEQKLAVGKVTYSNAITIKDCSSITELYTFYPVMENTYTAAEKGYYLNSAQNSFVYNVNEKAYVQPLRYYMTIQNRSDGSYIVPANGGASKAKFCVIGEGEATGITDIVDDAANASGKVYNLQGVLVGNTTEGLPKGVYIKNGRKMIVK